MLKFSSPIIKRAFTPRPGRQLRRWRIAMPALCNGGHDVPVLCGLSAMGRPAMVLFKFVKAIWVGAPIKICNHGNMRLHFIYSDALVVCG